MSDWIWAGVDRLVANRGGDAAGLRAHGLHLLAAHRAHRLGLGIDEEPLRARRLAAVRTLAAPPLLSRIRALVDGPILLLKGPEVAARYPDPALRPFQDLDLLVPDPGAVQRRLLEAGFAPVGCTADFARHHHEAPLRAPDGPLVVEVHGAPAWPDWGHPPRFGDLLAAAVTSETGVEGILAPAAAHHALLLAAHSWVHGPLPRALDLVDVAALAEECSPGTLDAVARLWGLERVWATTIGAAVSLLADHAPLSWPLLLWARHLPALREPLQIESRSARWLWGPCWAPTPGRAVASMARTVGRDLRPHPGEGGSAKLERVGRTLRGAFSGRPDNRTSTAVGPVLATVGPVTAVGSGEDA